MNYRRLGKSGLKLSELSFGSWITFGNQIQLKDAKELMSLAYDHGVNFFDNAEVYAKGQSEIIMGQAIKELGWSRDSFVVSSKVFWGGDLPTQKGLSRKHLIDACNSALKRFQLEYLDLYFCHRPDPEVPMEEIVWTMNDLLRQGKILYWGTSEWSASEIIEASKVAKNLNLVGPTMEQPEYNLFWKQRVEEDYGFLYEEIGLGLTTWSPLASGILAGKYNTSIPTDSRAYVKGYEWIKEKMESEQGKRKIEAAKKLEVVAKNVNMSLAQLSIAWCLKNPNVSSVILGASKLEQLKENLKSIDFKITREIEKEIEKII